MIPSVVSRIALIFPKSRSTGLRGCILLRSNLATNCAIKVPSRALPECGPTLFSYQQRRFKHKKKGAKEVEEDDDDDYDSDEEIEEPGSKVITGHVASLRADLVLKFGLGIARNKIETLFYESKIRVNGAKILKKSQKVYVDDELDVIKGPSPVNENMTIVSRVVVLSAKEHEDGDKLVVKLRRYKSLTIESEDQ